MVSKQSQNTENNAVMDYPEHERTFALFMFGAKWLTAIVVALLVAMAFGFFAGAGFFGGLVAFVALCAVAWFFL